MNLQKSTFTAIVFTFFLQSINSQVPEWQTYVDKAPFKVELPQPAKSSLSQKTISVKDYGAVADGKTINTEAFQKAIDEGSAKGNTVISVPAGIWLLGPIELKSDITIQINKGAVLQFTKDRTKYPMLAKNSAGTDYFVMSPIYAKNVKNITITGEGIIDGGGDSWRPVKKSKVTAEFWNDLIKTGTLSDDKKVWWPSQNAMNGDRILNDLKKKQNASADDFLKTRDFQRPYLMNLINCKNLQMSGITIQNSPKLTVYISQSDGVILNNLKVLNPKWGQNTDGIDISGSKNVLVYGCTVDVGDDGICMKSSSKKNENDVQLENIIIAKNTVYNAHGGFSIGSNTDGGMKNIFVTDCTFDGTDIGIRVKSNEGIGGKVSNIYIENIKMANIVNEAVYLSSIYENKQVGKSNDNLTRGEKIPDYSYFYLKNIVCTGAETAISLTGLENAPIHDLFFDNVSITATNGFIAENAENISMKNTKIIATAKLFDLKNTTNILLDEKPVN